MAKDRDVASRQLALDGLRGLSCLLIALYHAYPSARPLFWAWTLVDLFFVLSGFLIGRILYQGLTSQTLSLKNFFIRRALRIWPVYFLALMAALLLFSEGLFGLGRYAATDETSQRLSWVFLQFTDFYLKPGASLEASLTSYIPWFSQSWSIAAEEQFYLLLPALLLLMGVTRARFLWLALAAYALSMLMRQQGFALGLLGTRLDGFALGLVMVVLWTGIQEANTAVQRQRAKRIAQAAMALAVVAAVALAGPVFVRTVSGFLGLTTLHFDMTDLHLFLQGMVLAYFVLVAHVLLYPASGLARLLAARWCVHLGVLSYAIYMFHPILEGVFLHLAQAEHLRETSALTQVAYWVSLWVTAEVSSRTVEWFFNSLKARFPVTQTPKASPVYVPA